MKSGKDWSQASDEEVRLAASKVTKMDKEAEEILAEAYRRKSAATSPQDQAEASADQPKEYWTLGLVMLFFNGFLSALAVTSRTPGDPFVLRYVESVFAVWTLDPRVFGAAIFPYKMAAVWLVLAMLFKPTRNRRAASLVLVVPMGLVMLSSLFRNVILEIAYLTR